MMVVKNKFGIADIGTFGVNSQGTRGGYEIQGILKFDLTNGNWTSIYYFNRPDMAIPYRYGYYLHDEMPAYMMRRKGRWLVGSYEQIKAFINDRAYE